MSTMHPSQRDGDTASTFRKEMKKRHKRLRNGLASPEAVGGVPLETEVLGRLHYKGKFKFRNQGMNQFK